MEIPVMVMKAAINIQEDKIVEVMEAAEVLDMTAGQIMDQVMEAGVNLQEASLVAALAGAQVAVPGELVAMRAVAATADIQKISI